LRPIGIGPVLVRFANRALLAVIGYKVSQWLAARRQFGVEIVQFMARATLDASSDWADMQGDASNAFNEFLLRRPLFWELSANPALRPLLRVAPILYGSSSTLYVYDSPNAHGPAMRIPGTRGVHQGCVLGVMFFAIVASRVYKQLAAIVRNESVVCGNSDDGHLLGPPASQVVAIGDAMPEAYASVGLTVTIRENVCIPLWGSVMLSTIYPTATSCGEYMSPRKGRKY
jgi:hypothetical protein